MIAGDNIRIIDAREVKADAVANLLGISRDTLRCRIEKFGISRR